MASLVSRMIRAAQLDVSLYEEVEAERDAMGQALTVVILSSLALGISSYSRIGLRGLILGTFAALMGWFLWALLTYWIGTRILPETGTQADLGQLLRTIGFSSSPGILRVLGITPALWGAIAFLTSIWMLVAMVIAVRQALDYRSTWRAVGVCILGWLVQGAALLLLYGLSRTLPPA